MKNILNNKEYAKLYENKVLRIKRQEKINMQEIEMLLEIKLISKILEEILTQIHLWTVVPLKPEMN